MKQTKPGSPAQVRRYGTESVMTFRTATIIVIGCVAVSAAIVAGALTDQGLGAALLAWAGVLGQ